MERQSPRVGRRNSARKSFQASLCFGRSEAIEYDGHVGVASGKYPPDEECTSTEGIVG
jgi:hypothetical protein